MNSTQIAEAMGQIVRNHRQKCGLSQQELSELAGTRQEYISRVENGRNIPSMKFLYRIAEVTDSTLLLPDFKKTKHE